MRQRGCTRPVPHGLRDKNECTAGGVSAIERSCLEDVWIGEVGQMSRGGSEQNVDEVVISRVRMPTGAVLEWVSGDHSYAGF